MLANKINSLNLSMNLVTRSTLDIDAALSLMSALSR
jgi:hypothetical protein